MTFVYPLAARFRQRSGRFFLSLQAYLNPNVLEPDTWNETYPNLPFTLKVDYNAKRLAVTSINHAGWGATLMAARSNPYADFLHWELTPAHVINDVCDGYAGHDEGLGEGNWNLDAAPLPHPWCTCLWYVDTSKTLDEIAKELKAWEDGESNPRLDEAFGEWERKYTNTGKSGIIKMNPRKMADGHRQPRNYLLDDDDIAEIIREARAIGINESSLAFNKGSQTSYSDFRDIIYIRGDIFPDNSSNHPRDRLTVRAVLAHEYYGHRVFRGTSLLPGAWQDEFRASYHAAINAPGLSDEDRRTLMLDAVERAKEANVPIKMNAIMRRLIYGEDYE